MERGKLRRRILSARFKLPTAGISDLGAAGGKSGMIKRESSSYNSRVSVAHVLWEEGSMDQLKSSADRGLRFYHYLKTGDPR